MIDPINIGSVRLENPLIQAPLAGITNLPFRIVCRMGGAGLVWSEMISSKALHFQDRRTKEMALFDPSEHPVAAQIFGRDPGELADAARYIADRGADIIDINMGCPVKKILKSGSGVQLMREPDLACAIVKEVVKAVSCPVTVKFRLGWAQGEINYLEMGKAFEEAGAAALTLHPRTRVQGFTGIPDIAAIGRLTEAVGIPVIGSGDVKDGESAQRMLAETGCAGVMIGRGVLGKPWIFDEVRAYITGTKTETSGNFRPELVQKHINLLLQHLPDRRSVGHLRKHLAWYSKGFPEGAGFRREVNRLTEPGEIVELAEEFLYLKVEGGRWKVE